MSNVLLFLNQIFLFLIIFLLLLYLYNNFLKRKVLYNHIISNLSSNITKIKKRNLINISKKIITPTSIILLCIGCFLIFFFITYSFTKMFIYSIIFSIPFLFIPYIVLKFKIRQEKESIKKILPIYAINLKGHMTNENNIILAIKRTKVEEPLYKYISKFIANIERGMNIIDAFNILKDDVDVIEFTELISAFQVCYQNGGKFAGILEVFSRQISNLLTLEQKEKEKTFSSVLTLVVMMSLNIFLIISYVFGNKEFANVFRDSISGHIVMDINAISCIVCVYFLFKMYKMEE